ncbi:MAG: hypothetical protein U0353_29760 [Sandaracinus sp.]
MTGVAEEMRGLAEELARGREGLDVSLESLTGLDALVASDRAGKIASRAIGAYLGEAIRRAAPDSFVWVDDPGGPVLCAGGARWFPIEKVEKRRREGAGNDLSAFAGVVLALTPEAASRLDMAIDEPRVREGRAAVARAVAAFRGAPNVGSFLQLDRTLHGQLAQRHHRDALAAAALTAETLMPFLEVPASGRGYERTDPGRAAAGFLAYLVQLGLAPREHVIELLRPRLRERNKAVRTNVAHALVEIDLASGSAAVALELGATKDAALTEGAVRAIRSIGGDVRMDRCDPPVPLASLDRVLGPALSPSSACLRLALEAVNDWAMRPDTAVEAKHLAPLLDAIAKRGKPDARRFASQIAARTRNAIPRPRRPEPARRTHTCTFVSIEPGASYTCSERGLSTLRELMREVGALADPTATRALRDGPPVDPEAPPITKYLSHATAAVTPAECRVVATRLLAHLDVVREVASFFDDAPSGSELTAWVTSWAEFHARSADLGGHRPG